MPSSLIVCFAHRKEQSD